MVPIQLKILTAVGTAMTTVEVAKNPCATSGRPTANIWWAQTVTLMNPMATVEVATAA